MSTNVNKWWAYGSFNVNVDIFQKMLFKIFNFKYRKFSSVANMFARGGNISQILASMIEGSIEFVCFKYMFLHSLNTAD